MRSVASFYADPMSDVGVVLETLGQMLRSGDRALHDEAVATFHVLIELYLRGLRSASDMADAAPFFRSLQVLQFVLARASFKDSIPLSPYLNRAVRAFDRLDDLGVRERLFVAVRSPDFEL